MRAAAEDDKIPEGQNRSICWILEYTGEADSATAVISGIEEEINEWINTSPTVDVKDLGNGSIQVSLDMSEPWEENGFAQLMDKQGQYFLYLIIKAPSASQE